jgi:hypothetical protein
MLLKTSSSFLVIKGIVRGLPFHGLNVPLHLSPEVSVRAQLVKSMAVMAYSPWLI